MRPRIPPNRHRHRDLLLVVGVAAFLVALLPTSANAESNLIPDVWVSSPYKKIRHQGFVSCSPDPCQNGGVCVPSPQGELHCNCTSKYVGEFCQHRNPCLTGARCQNGGSCRVKESLTGGTPGFVCDCPIGYSASLCEIKIDNACDSSPCINNGSCVLQSLSDYTCSCSYGYTGEYCEKLDYCASSPCRNGASCRSLNYNYQCTCSEGFTGPNCSEDIDECETNPCVHGSCLNTHGSFNCVDLDADEIERRRGGGGGRGGKVGDYDMLIFTQAWTPTSCFEWKDKSPTNKCNLPPMEEWSIHGLWPNKNHHMGPFFCNATAKFDIGALQPLMAQLELKWIDIHLNSKHNEFWKHEWVKHGTCSMDIPELKSEKLYFTKALQLLDVYDMKHVLTKAGVLPNSSNRFQYFLDAVHKILEKNAYIECVRNPHKNQTYIAELRVCLDKKLQLIDCDGMPHYPTNCHADEMVIYPGTTPSIPPTVVQV